ncbi:MAG: hypothetical protein CL870_01485 [Cytophagia bacterium]|jgi:hypothetical protein|nr:hypothetical protein [Cytophagia bacterium]
MSKHLKEFIFIILSVSPLFFMTIISNILETPSDMSFERIDRKMLMISNAVFLLLFLVPYFVIRKNVNYNLGMRNVAIYPLALVTLSTFFFIIINSPVIEWNKEINFPDFLSSFEFWAQAKEKQLEAVTIHLVSFENNFEYLIGILTIAIIPGFCEEYFFRGVLQKNLSLLIKNHHVAILISAFIFSAFHLQFYGFFPRLLLGVLFGYFYYWSGSLTYSIIAHTLNNFFSLTLFYVARNGFFGDNIELDINSSPDIPLFIIIGALIIFCYLIFLLKKSNKNLNE